MKSQIKYFLLALILIINSCSSDTVKISKEEYNKLKGDTNDPIYPKPFELYNTEKISLYDNGIVMGSDGHEYLIIKYKSNGENVLHYVDCQKCSLTNKKN
jgi:PBP1b-binding outer membrane lipoprotein LpoB